MSKKSRKIEIKQLTKSEPPKVNTLADLSYPVFCFKHLHTPAIEKCPKGDLLLMRQFIERLSKLCSLGWSEINVSHKHSFGWEKIRVDDIKIKCPPFVTSDVTHLLAFRYGGNNLPFLCLRSHSNVLHILFIELHHGDVYKHD